MSTNKQGGQNVGAKSRDHAEHRHSALKHAHKDWRVWVVAGLMVSLVLVYVMTDGLSLRPSGSVVQPMPAANVP